MKKKLIGIVLLAAAAAAGVFIYWRCSHPAVDPSSLTLYGNVDIRQVNLGFRVGGRIAAVAVDEGDPVQAGQVLARLDDSVYAARVAAAQAALEVAEAKMEMMHNGNRPEEIERARALVEMLVATLRNAELQHERNQELIKSHAVAQREVDQTQAKRDESKAQLEMARAQLQLLQDGFRKEEIAQAAAAVEQARAELALARQDLADATILAPADGTVQTRIQEPGAIVGAGAPLLTVTLVKPVWVRAYVKEADLGKIRPGLKVAIRNDSDPDRAYAGTIGFISPVAEFTPKSVETASMRTDLVYRIRIVVDEPGEWLRQGMPVTVDIDTADAGK